MPTQPGKRQLVQKIIALALTDDPPETEHVEIAATLS
jgi:hypothetical protein